MQELITFLSNHMLLTIAVIVVFILITIVELIRTKRGVKQIIPAAAVQLMNRHNAVMVDIRPLDAYQKGHIIDAQSIPISELKVTLKKLEKFKGKPLVVVCTNGTESQKIATLLTKNGYNAYSLSGGMRGWLEAQMPIVKAS